MSSLKLHATLLGVCVLAGCSDSSPSLTGSSPTSMMAPVVRAQQVIVGGIPVRGSVGRGTDEPSLFRIHVDAPGGASTVRRVVMEYSQPGPNHHGGPMRGGYAGSVECYDDGTHGDDVAGDGIYHYMDPDDRIGCHALNAPTGEYHYTFWCEDVYGQRSNTASVSVTRR